MPDTLPTFETKEKNKMIRYAQSKKLPQTTGVDMSNLDEGGFFLWLKMMYILRRRFLFLVNFSLYRVFCLSNSLSFVKIMSVLSTF